MNDVKTYEKVENAIKNIKADVVFTLSLNDYHMDHRNISQIVVDTDLDPLFMCDTLIGIQFEPEFYVDITEFSELKKKMLSEHKSQNYEALIEYNEVVSRFR